MNIEDEYGRWNMEDEIWKMEYGRWNMEDEIWKMKYGRWIWNMNIEDEYGRCIRNQFRGEFKDE